MERAGTARYSPATMSSASSARPLVLTPSRTLQKLVVEEHAAAPIDGAVWYVAGEVGDGLEYRFDAGALASCRWLSADMLLEGVEAAVFLLTLREGEGGAAFHMHFGLLNQCAARMRIPLAAVNQNRWMYNREGAWLKPLCGGARVDLAKVDRASLTILRKGDAPVRWCMTPIAGAFDEPPRLEAPLLPRGPLLDELGQWTLRTWPGKSAGAEEVTARLRSQLAAAPRQQWPDGFSRWGGWTGRRVEASGFFRTHHDGRRWWLVDPDGFLYWSAGLDCVRPGVEANFSGLEKALTSAPPADGEFSAIYGAHPMGRSIDYLKANFIRAFGRDGWRDAWARITIGQLKDWGFNTIANWSDWQAARSARFPYVRPLDGRAIRATTIYRDFPDVFDPSFEKAAADYARQLADTADDPALVGYFLMNEPTWGFAAETPAAGMLHNTERCATRAALAKHLAGKYGTDAALSTAWGVRTGFEEVERGWWKHPLNRTARDDLAAFSTLMVEKLFHTLSAACRAVDPHHLNLGARYYTVPPQWALAGMTCFDVFSINCYQERVPREPLARIDALLRRPVLVGEWHFGAHDVGLPASGIGRVASQADRGRAYRVYLENAAALPQCVGVHYFTLYDQSALGRFDGENYNIGFLDVCNRPYEPLVEAARTAHRRMYDIAAGKLEPYADAPKYLPRLFY